MMKPPFYSDYDAYGRFSAVTAQVHVLTHGYAYGYLTGSDLVETMANSHGHTVTRTYDPAMPYITRVHNGFTGGRTVSQYDYAYDAMGRRTAVASSGEAFSFSNANDLAAFNLYGYNGEGRVNPENRIPLKNPLSAMSARLADRVLRPQSAA